MALITAKRVNAMLARTIASSSLFICMELVELVVQGVSADRELPQFSILL